ncbi:hypothetical protein Tco_1233276 [Tanacetum coccineum]
MYHQKNVDYVELLWEDFTYQIDNKVYKKQGKMYYPHFTKVIIHHFLIQEKSLSWRNRIRMHTSKDDYLINTLRFVSRREASQKYGVVLPECLTSPEMKESKAYKTYLSYTTAEVPPKAARKFKKASPSKKESELVPRDEEPIKKGKRLKTPARKSASKPPTGIVIREPPVETKSKRKEKEKVDVAHGKGIELLSEVALSEKAQIKEARMKSLREFHKTHPSGSGTVIEKPPSVEKITPTVISEGIGDKPRVPGVTNDDSFESESESWGNDKEDSNNEQESSDESSKQENESDEQELDSEQDEESDDDDQEQEDFYQENVSEDDEMKKPTKTATGIVQGEGNDAEITEAQQGNENLETTQEQVVEDAHVTISTLPKKTEVPVTSSSRLSDLASKFLIFLDIPQTDAEIVSPLDVHVHHEVPRTQAPTLLTIPVLLIHESSPLKKILLDKMEKSESYLTAPKHRDCYDGLKKSYALDKYFFYSYDEYSLKRSRKDKDKDEDPSAGSDRGLKKRKISKDAEPTTESKKKDSTSGSSKGTKSQPKSTGKSDFDELMSTPIDFSRYILNGLKIENLTQEVLLGPAFRLLKGTRSSYAELEYEFKECYKALSEKLDWENPEGVSSRRNLDYDIHDVAYDKYALWGISYWREQCKSFYAFARDMQSRGDVYSTKHILAVTHVSVMRKHRYGYLEEIVVRRDDNALYRFKEGDFPRLRINDIEDMLILMVHNWLTNLSGDNVADFVIALRMFTRSLVIQKRVEDLQLGVESYAYLRKRHMYTPYKEPQGFIYVDDHKRNRLMRSNELYKFSNYTLIRLLSSLEDIAKNIDMSTLPEEEMEQFGKEKSSFHDQGHQQDAKGKEDDEEFGRNTFVRLDSTELTRLLQREQYNLSYCSYSRDYTHFYRPSHFELVDIEKVAVCSSLRSLKTKYSIESKAKRDHPYISLGHLSNHAC